MMCWYGVLIVDISFLKILAFADMLSYTKKSTALFNRFNLKIKLF